MVGVELTADREHNPSAPRAVNFQHRPSPVSLNAMATPMGKFLKLRIHAGVPRRDFGNGEIRDNTNFRIALSLASESASCVSSAHECSIQAWNAEFRAERPRHKGQKIALEDRVTHSPSSHSLRMLVF